jgi:acetyl-CoA carboxylase biotin carboxylase subunit
MFDKVLIANRGEIALRVIRTCREMGVATVAVHSPVDRGAPHVLAADQAVALPGDAPADSYLNIERLVAAAADTGAQAVHPGYGFLAENGDFAQACQTAGLTFIGPPADVLRAVGDKLTARELAQAAEVPVTPGTPEPASDPDLLVKQAAEIGYPVMLKAAAGGGGKGMRKVDDPGQLAEAVARAASEAKAAFSDDRVYLEKCIVEPRHVEVQILADDHGQVIHLFERECSVQRRHQKIIEEAPSPALDEDLRVRMCAAATAVAKQAGYRNAGTVEFLLDADGAFYFMEVNARLQVEHPVTEAICGLDLVRAQLLLAAGERLPWTQDQITRRGWALECRIYAEDPKAGFMPSPGRVLGLQPPAGPGVRFDCGVEPGTQVPVEYDPILAKLITWGEDRPAALSRMARALAETAVLGVDTAVELLLDVVASEPFGAGRLTTAFLDDHFADWQPGPERTRALLAGWLAAELTGVGARLTCAAEGGPAGGPVDPWDTLSGFRLEG